MASEPIEIWVELIMITNAAILINDGQTEAWLPKSQIEYDDDAEPGDTIDIEMPEWLAVEKDLV